MRRILAVALLSFLAAPATHAGSLFWSGEIVVVDTDTGAGTYTGALPTDPFSGEFAWPDVCGATCTVEPFPPEATNYVFSDGTGEITGLGIPTPGIESNIEIINEDVVSQDGVDIAALFGITLTVGQTIDSWVVGSESVGEFTPAFKEWNVTYIYITTDPFTDTSFTPTPPPNPDIILFDLTEDDGDVFLAIGEVTSVPEPGTTLGLACGAAFLGLASRRRR